MTNHCIVTTRPRSTLPDGAAEKLADLEFVHLPAEGKSGGWARYHYTLTIFPVREVMWELEYAGLPLNLFCAVDEDGKWFPDLSKMAEEA